MLNTIFQPDLPSTKYKAMKGSNYQISVNRKASLLDNAYQWVFSKNIHVLAQYLLYVLQYFHEILEIQGSVHMHIKDKS